MECAGGTFAFGRLLVGMSERATRGVVTVHAGTRTVRLSISKGRLYAVEGTGHAVLGDVLLDHGACIPGLATDSGTDMALVGSRLVARGIVSAAQLSRALRALHVARMRWLFSHAELRVGDVQVLPSLGAHLRASLPLAGAILDAVLRACDVTPSREEARRWSPLSVRGQRAVTELLEHVSPFAVNTRPPTARPIVDRRTRQLRCLDALGFSAASPALGSYAELFRMRRAVSRGGALGVLALPAGASRAEARLRLRTLARRVHPDLFAGEHPELARQANALLSELTRAADALTWGRPRTA